MVPSESAWEPVWRLGGACHGAFLRRDGSGVLQGDMWCEILTKGGAAVDAWRFFTCCGGVWLEGLEKRKG